jgi:hypothetical protein
MGAFGFTAACVVTFLVSCQSGQLPDRKLDTLTICGVPMFSGYVAMRPLTPGVPTAAQRAHAPSPGNGTNLPPSAPSGQKPTITSVVARISDDCAQGHDVKVSPSAGLETTAVARDHDGRVTALALARTGSPAQIITIYIYDNDALTGVIAA